MKKIIITILILVLGLIIISIVLKDNKDGSDAIGTPIAEVVYACNQGKTINASFIEGKNIPVITPGEPPVPTGSVDLSLSDGRKMTLSSTISADGARYANPDDSFVFWSKGNSALVLENNEEKSYIGCVKVVPDTGGLPEIYQNGTSLISIRYPTGYKVDNNYKYQALGPDKDINGVKFTIPDSMATGTNLSADSYISVEQIPGKNNCSASDFTNMNTKAQTLSDSGIDYSFASSSNAGAGNRYEEFIYALPGTSPCTAVRYFIHYSIFENYPEGTIKQFDKSAIINQFDQIRRTLVVNPKY